MLRNILLHNLRICYVLDILIQATAIIKIELITLPVNLSSV